MKLNVLRPQKLVDVNGLHSTEAAVHATPDGLKLSAFARMAAVAAHLEGVSIQQ
jgi:CO/xanthine dehydrogenase FAD-binding subunit